MKRNQKLTKDRYQRIGEDFRLIYLCGSIQKLVFLNDLDVNMKNPIIHSKINRCIEYSKDIVNFVKPALNTSDEDGIMQCVYELSEIFKMFSSMDKSQINETYEGMKKMFLENEK